MFLINSPLPCKSIYGKGLFYQFGTYDFVVPPAVGQDVIDRVRSTDKKLVILPRSGHDPYFTEPDAVNAEVISFVERLR